MQCMWKTFLLLITIMICDGNTTLLVHSKVSLAYYRLLGFVERFGYHGMNYCPVKGNYAILTKFSDGMTLKHLPQNCQKHLFSNN